MSLPQSVRYCMRDGWAHALVEQDCDHNVDEHDLMKQDERDEERADGEHAPPLAIGLAK